MEAAISQIENLGELHIGGHLSSLTDSLGNIHFVGSDNQVLVGTELVAKNLIMNKPGRLELGAMEVTIQDTLVLNNGILASGSTELKVIKSIDGGNNNSFIEGSYMTISSDGELHIPLGIDGLYQPIYLNGMSADRKLKAGISKPIDDALLVSDSLVGINSTFLWTIEIDESEGEDEIVESRAVFQQIDLENFISENPIRAFKYSPTMALRAPDDSLFRTLGIASLVNTDSLTFGEISAMLPFRMSAEKEYTLAIGRMPLSTGLRFYVPNAFAPRSNNSENSRFRPFLEGVTISSVQMTVWNEFNNPVFSVNESEPDFENFGWNGTQENGSDAPQGVYFYEIVVNTPVQSFEKSGTVLLVR